MCRDTCLRLWTVWGQLTGDSRYLEYIKKYMDHFVDEAGNYKGGGLTNLDNFMTGSAFLYIIRTYGGMRNTRKLPCKY